MVIFVLGLGAIIWGLVAQGWYMNEISAIFLAMALLSGVVSGMNEKEIAGEFVKELQISRSLPSLLDLPAESS